MSDPWRAMLSAPMQALYRQFDAACDRQDWDAADALLCRIQSAHAAPVNYAFADIQSTELH